MENDKDSTQHLELLRTKHQASSLSNIVLKQVSIKILTPLSISSTGIRGRFCDPLYSSVT